MMTKMNVGYTQVLIDLIKVGLSLLCAIVEVCLELITLKTVVSSLGQIPESKQTHLGVILNNPFEQTDSHHSSMTHGRGGLVKAVIFSGLVKESNGKETVKNGIHNPSSSPLQKHVHSLGSPKPQSVIMVEIVGHVSFPTTMELFILDLLISRFPSLWIHLLSNLHWHQ